MARSRKQSQSMFKGSTLFGLLFGLIIGVGLAAGVAYFVTQVPMPFVDKATRDPAKTLLPDVRDAPDPNIGLFGKDGAAGNRQEGPIDTAPTPLPGAVPGTGVTPPASPLTDDIGALLATLGAPTADTAVKPVAPEPKAAKPAAPQTTYFLQAGAFRSESDAEAVKAKILLMGLPVQVQKAQVNGSTMHRVRVGPFKGIDEMNRSRVRLGEAKIDSSVVRP